MLILCTSSQALYNHPGIFNSQEELDFIREKVNGSAAHPMKQGYSNLLSFYGANLNYNNQPKATVQVEAGSVGADEQNFRDASHAAYAHALLWVITGDARHRDKSLQIMNGWAAVFKGMSLLSNHQEDLEASWAIPTWVAGAEIMRYYNKGSAGWAGADVAKFSAMLDILEGYAAYTITPRKMLNNWGTSAALAVMAVGVFEQDSAKFNLGMNYLDTLLPNTVEKTGLVMETCRDCNHAEYNMLGIMGAAEIAWHQGIDFYGRMLDGQTTPRLLMGMEFQASGFLGKPMNVGQSCGPQNCSGEDKHASGWEVGLNHYRYRMNIPAPVTTTFVTTQNRPDGLSEDHFTGWSTLTHAELGNIPSALNGGTGKFGEAAGPARGKSDFSVVRRGDEVTLRYRLTEVTSLQKPSIVEIYSTRGRRLCSVLLYTASGELPLRSADAAALGYGPYLFRVNLAP